MLQKRLSHFLLLIFFMSVFHDIQAQTTSWVSWATNQAKLDTFRTFGIYVADVNNDRYPDMVTVDGAWSTLAINTLHVYMNVQDPESSDPHTRIFVDVTANSGVNAKPGGGNSVATLTVALADVNNDGNIDLVKGPYYHRIETYTDNGDRCEVLLGDGQGHFTLVSNNGLHDMGLINTTGFSFLDYNKDGKIDLFVAGWFKDYTNDIWAPGHLMKGNGDGTFADVSTAAGITTKEPMYGCSAIDWNNDGWPDIATAPYCRTRGQLLKNNGNGTFTDVAVSEGYNLKYMQGDNGQNVCMWSNVPEDFDNDGDMDFLYALVHGGNDPGEGHSTIVMNAGAANNYSLSWDLNRITWNNPKSTHQGDYDASWFDLDNDGLEDIVLTQGTYTPTTDRLFIFHQQQDNTFMDVTQDLGLITANTKDLHVTEALDYDMDGDDDVIYCRNGQPRTLNLIKNEIGQTKNWVGIRLVAPADVNYNSIGARIYLWTGGVQRMREVYAGRGNDGGQQPLAMLFGLGANTTIDSIKVQWPNTGSTITKVTNIPINRYVTITQNGLGVEATANETQTQLKVYPNPAKDFILVQMSNNDKDAAVAIYNMMGQKLDNVAISNQGSSTKYCAINQLPIGTYIVKATTKEGRIYTQPFIKVD